jgi:hypothetical protein
MARGLFGDGLLLLICCSYSSESRIKTSQVEYIR